MGSPGVILPAQINPSSPSQTSSATGVAAQTGAATPLPPISGASAPSAQAAPSQSSRINCVYHVQPGDVLSAVAERFGLGASGFEKIFCDPGTANSACDLGDPAHIEPGWVIIIPDVPTSGCIENDGTVQIATP